MTYFVIFLAGFASAAAPLVIWYYGYVLLLRKERQAVADTANRLENESNRLRSDAHRLKNEADSLTQQIAECQATRRQQDAEYQNTRRQLDADYQNARRQLEVECQNTRRLLETERQNTRSLLDAECQDKRRQLAAERQSARRQLEDAMAAFQAKKIQYSDLVRENGGLKQDLFNLSVQTRKMERDHAAIMQRQEEIRQQADGLAARYLNENVAWIGEQLNSNNFASCKQRLLKVIEACRRIGFAVPEEKEQELVANLKQEYEEAVRKEFQREEQARIKAQIREEERIAREADKHIQEAQREEAAIKAALEKALKEAKDEHSAEVERLKDKLREAEEKSQRAKSQAQMTKAGHVYVLSNIGSFGEGVFKVGMTRRLDPQDRVKELGDASVPFEFDVHMMIPSNDAPSLENALHRELHRQRVNKVNFRKEFFRADLACIRKIVETVQGEVKGVYVAEPPALQYRETLSIKDEDYEFMEHTVESMMDATGAVADD